MANRKINELSPRTPSLTDLIIVGDPSTGYSFKATISVLAAFAGSNIQFSSLGGVSITSPSNGQYLTFNGTNWVNSTLSTTTWDTAYNRSLTAAAVTGTTNKTLTLTKQDGSTLTASWSDLNTDAVTSVFGRTGVVVAAEGDYTLDQLGGVTITTPSTNQVLQYNGTDWVNATFVAGINSLNGLTATTQTFATGTSGTDFAISSTTATHTFNLPTASATNRGALSSADWTTFNGKVGGSGTTNYLSKWTGSSALGNSLVFDNGTQLGIGTTTPTTGYELDLVGDQRISGNLLLGSSGSGVRIQNSTTNFGTITIGSDGYSGSGMSIAPYYGGSIGWITGPSASYEINFNTHLGVRGKDFSQYNSSGTIAFYIKNSNGNVIIGNGTTDAGFKLDVTGTFRSTLDANINGLTVGKGGGQILTNTAVGYEAIFNSTTGAINNIAQGYQALRTNTTGNNNSALGYVALYTNSVGIRNTAVGSFALQGSNSDNNTGVGFQNLLDVTSGQGNTAIGSNTARGITTGSYNTIIGSQITGLSSSLSNTIILADGQGNQRLYINSSGNAAIGTSTLVSKSGRWLQITATSNVESSLVLNRTGGVSDARWDLYIPASSNNLRLYNSNAGDIMQFGNNGNVLIGTTTDAGYKLDISGTFRSTLDANINGLTVGKGGGSISTNTAFGVSAISKVGTTGTYNVGVGVSALNNLTSGTSNTAIGAALVNLTTGNANIGIGHRVGESGLNGDNNIGIGVEAFLYTGATTSSSIAIGRRSLWFSTGSTNIAIGHLSAGDLTTGSNNIIIGGQSTGVTTGSNNTLIGAVTGLSASLSNTIILADGQGNQRLYIDNTGNVGIGTTGPTHNLHINAVNPTIRLTTTSGANTTFSSNGDLYINTSTRVGINSPYGQLVQTLSVYGTIGNPGAFRQYVLGGGVTAALPTYSFYGDANNGWFSPAADVQAWSVSGGEVMRLFSTGNLLVGSSGTDAGYKLDVNGTARVSTLTTGSASSSADAIYSFVGTARRGLVLRNDNNNTQSAIAFNSLISSAYYSASFGLFGIGGSTDLVTCFGNGGLSGTLSHILASNGDFKITGTGLFGSTSTPNASAVLEATSTTKGFLPPRMTTTQKNAIATPAAGLVVYDTTLAKLCVYTTAWETITSV